MQPGISSNAWRTVVPFEVEDIDFVALIFKKSLQ